MDFLRVIKNNRGSIGGGASGSKTNQSSNTTVQATPEETELNKLDLALRQETQPQLIDVNKLALGLSGNLLSGQDLPGYLQKLPGGISPEVTQDIVNQSLKDVANQAQYSGILDSGTAGALATRTSADVRTQAEQFNLQNLLQLLNLAVGSSAQVQSPIQGFGNQLSQRLQGLRSTSTTTTTKEKPDWLKLSGEAALGAAMVMCWVAKEIFGSWEHPKTISARYYINNIAPDWFRDLYMEYGERIANYISDKLLLKLALRPLFEVFAIIGKHAIAKENVYA